MAFYGRKQLLISWISPIHDLLYLIGFEVYHFVESNAGLVGVRFFASTGSLHAVTSSWAQVAPLFLCIASTGYVMYEYSSRLDIGLDC